MSVSERTRRRRANQGRAISELFVKQGEMQRQRELADKHLIESRTEPASEALVRLDPSDLTDLLFSNHGASGLFVSGDAGSGKSVTLDNILRALAVSGSCGILLIDPAGDLSKAFRNFCLARGGSVAERMQYIQLANPNVTAPLHPLHVLRRDEMSEIEFRARLEARVGYVTHILLAAWGQTSWENTPLLYQYTSLFLRSIALMGLTMADVLHFLSPQSPLFRQLADHVPDYFARLELYRLLEMKPKEAYDEIRSTLLRLRGFLANLIVQSVLGVDEGFIDCRQMIQQQQIVILDASNPGTLREEDVQILCNLWLCEWYDAVFSAQQHERAPSAIVVDELPLFAPSFPMIERNLRLMRKTLTRFIGATQGTQSFPSGVDCPLLQAMTGQTGVKVIHRHAAPRDTQFWSEFAATWLYDAKTVKFEHWEDEQYQDGWELKETINRTFTQAYSHAEGGANSQHESVDEGDSLSKEQGQNRTATDSVNGSTERGSSHTDNRSQNEQSGTFNGMHQDEQLIHRAFNSGQSQLSGSQRGTADTTNQSQTLGRGRSLAGGTSLSLGHSRTRSRGFARDSSSNWLTTRNASMAETITQQWLPRHRWRSVLRMLEYYSWEEIQRTIARSIGTQRTGACFLAVAGLGITQVQMPLVSDPYMRSPNSLRTDFAAHMRRVAKLPQYHATRAILVYRQQRLTNAIRNLGLLLADARHAGDSDFAVPPDHSTPGCDPDSDPFCNEDPGLF